MLHLKTILFILIIIIVILVAFLMRLKDGGALGGGAEDDNKLLNKIKSIYDAFSSVRTYLSTNIKDASKETLMQISHKMLNLINTVTDYNLTLQDMNMLAKNGGWKILPGQFITKLLDVFSRALDRIKNGSMAFIASITNMLPEGIKFGGAVVEGSLLIGIIVIVMAIILGIVTVIAIAIPGIVAIVGIGTAGVSGIVLLATIFSIFNMYFNASIRRQALSQMEAETLAKEGTELAMKDVSGDQLYEFMHLTFGRATKSIEVLTSSGVDATATLGKSAMDSLSAVGSTAVGVVPFVGAGKVGGNIFTYRFSDVLKNSEYYIEVGDIVRGYLLNFNPEVVKMAIEQLKGGKPLGDYDNPAYQTLKGVLINIMLVKQELE